MLFQNIAALVAKGVVINMQITGADNGQLEVSIVPTSTTGKSGMSLVAKSFVASPAELDEGFADVIASYSVTNSSLKDQLEAMEAQAAQALKDAQEAKAAANASAPKSVSKSVAGVKKAVVPTLMSDDDAEGDDGESGCEDSADASSVGVDDPMPFTL